MAVKRRYSLFEIRWLVGNVHIGKSDLFVVKKILRASHGWPKVQRKMACRDALKAHHDNQKVYRYVLRGG